MKVRSQTNHLSIRSLAPAMTSKNLVDKLAYARSLKSRATRIINEIKSRFVEVGRPEFFGSKHVAIFQPMKFKRIDPDKVRAAIESFVGVDECERIWDSLHTEHTSDYLVLRRRDQYLAKKGAMASVEERV